jgi:hypothetical protein
MIHAVDRCPPNYEKSVYQRGQVVYLHGTGFRPYEPIYWSIWGTTTSCDADDRVAHSRMTADWNGSFCIYCYTVATDDCGTYRISVNNVHNTFYDVPLFAGPSATATGTPTGTPTASPTLEPTPYSFSGYVYEEIEQSDDDPPITAPLSGVKVQLYTGLGEDWDLVDQVLTTEAGWFGLSHVTGSDQPRFRIVEVDPPGYVSVGIDPPPLYAFLIDDNTIEMRMPYARSSGVITFYDRKAEPTLTPTATPTVTGTPPTPTPTRTPIPETNIKTRVLQQGLDGYQGVEDTYISSWFLRENYAGHNMLFIRSGSEMAPLLRFDLGFIPFNSTVLEATLSLYAAGAGPHDMRAQAYRVFRPWIVNETNWLVASEGYDWGEPGANELGVDRAQEPSDVEELTEVEQWYAFDVTEMAQEWVSTPGQNQGVILKGAGDVSVQWKFYASEYWKQIYRPKLAITYGLGPATPTSTPTPRPTATPTDTATPTPTFIIPFED